MSDSPENMVQHYEELNRERILSMTENELAEATAVYAMGWREGEHPEVNGTGQWMAEYEFPVYFKDDGTFVTSLDWEPAESISDAWIIIQRLKEDYGVEIYEESGAPTECRLYVWQAGESRTVASAEANTAEIAICRAALLAVRGI